MFSDRQSRGQHRFGEALSAAIARFAAACESRLEVLSCRPYLYPCCADRIFLLADEKPPSASTRKIIHASIEQRVITIDKLLQARFLHTTFHCNSSESFRVK